jgi:TrmH family RNA methyltransferase
MITSPSNPRIKFVRSLQRAAIRRRQGLTVAEGRRLVGEALRHADVQLVLFDPAAGTEVQRLAGLAELAGIEVVACSSAALAPAADTETPQGILAVLPLPAPAPQPGVRLALVIDRVQDPGNVGGLARSAAAAGVTEVHCTAGTADALSPKALRGGAGAQFQIPITARRSPTALRQALAGLDLYAAVPDGDLSYDDPDWTRPSGIAIGSEAHGVSPAVRRLTRATVRIPMRPGADSLNAAAAAAVILFEAARQRAAQHASEDSGFAGSH